MVQLQQSLTRFVTRFALPALALAPSVTQAAYQNCVPTHVLTPEVVVKPAPQNDLGCSAGVTIALGDGSSVWRCTTGADNTLFSAKTMLLVSADGTSKKLPDSTSREGLGRFSVWLIDLDNDGTQERILSYWNGRGEDGITNSWTAIVFRADWGNLTPAGENDVRNMAGASDIHDWGPSNLIIDPADPKKCLLAISEFKTHNSVNGLKVDFYGLGTNSLAVTRSLPPVFRPLNSRLRAERRRTYRATPFSGDITRWISSPSAKPLPMP